MIYLVTGILVEEGGGEGEPVWPGRAHGPPLLLWLRHVELNLNITVLKN